jgi:hypothetical protein
MDIPTRHTLAHLYANQNSGNQKTSRICKGRSAFLAPKRSQSFWILYYFVRIDFFFPLQLRGQRPTRQSKRGVSSVPSTAPKPRSPIRPQQPPQSWNSGIANGSECRRGASNSPRSLSFAALSRRALSRRAAVFSPRGRLSRRALCRCAAISLVARAGRGTRSAPRPAPPGEISPPRPAPPSAPALARSARHCDHCSVCVCLFG